MLLVKSARNASLDNKTKSQKLNNHMENSSPTHQFDSTDWVINLSVRNLTNHKTTLLKKGVNFAVTDKHVPVTDTIAGVKSFIQNLDCETIDSARREVKTVLTKAKLPKSNITYEQRRALKSSKEDTSITILPADNGHTSVVLNTET